MAPRLRRWYRRSLAMDTLERRVAPATFTVLNTNDAGAGSLRQAVLDANAVAGADDIAFDPIFFATPRTITLTAANGQLDISDQVVVNGPGAGLLTVSGGGVTRVLTVASGAQIVTATLNGLTISGGNGAGPGQFNGYGGGILVGNAMNLTLNDAVVTGNSAPLRGGGIAVANSAFGGFITVRNSSIAGNSAGSNGGGLYFFFNGSLLMENSTVSSNVSGGAGGGMLFFGTVNSDGFTIRNSTFANNTASNGGGIHISGLIGTALIRNSTITGNSASTNGTAVGQGGGGISLFGTANSILSIDSCIISGNSAANGRGDIAKATAAILNLNKSAVGDPDGYTKSSGTGNLPAGAVLNMYPLAAYGGKTLTVALGVGSAAIDAGSNLSGLTTDQRGTGFPRAVGAAADIGAFEGTIDFPSASGGPYANVTVGGGTTYTFDVKYSGVTAIDVSTLDNNDVRVTGPGGFSQLATFVSATPAGNGTPRTATYQITAPGGTFGGEDNGTYSLTIQAGQVANTAGATTAATTVGTFSVNIPLTLTVTNLNDAGAGSLRQAILDANAAIGTADTINFQAGLTGTITLVEASGQLNVTDSLTITGPGAGLLTISGGGVVRIFNVTDNNATTAIAVNLSGLTLTAGAGRAGAGILDTGARAGGAIANANETVVLDGVIISDNVSEGRGGGMGTTSSGAVTIRNSTIANNSAFSGGGGISFPATGASLLMENTTISGNTANSGGGIFFYGAPGAGGFTVRNTTIAGNATTSEFGSGGGIAFVLASGTLLFQNSTITNNSSAETRTTEGFGGGGIAVITGGAARVLTLDSTIVSGNTVNSANANFDIATVAGTVTNANFSAIGDPDGFTLSGSSGNNLPFGTALNLLPLANNGGPTATIGLLLGSPAINAGRNTAGLTTDQRGAGFPRVVGTAADIGAFEGTIDAPSASGGPYANVPTGGGTTYTFDVTYSGATAIDVSTLDNNDVRVTGPGGFSQLATFVSVTPAGNGTPRTATYQIAAPGGTFGGEDNGTYTITVQVGQVANTNGGTVVNTVVGSFMVGIPHTYIVTNLADAGAGSLRQAIFDANASVNVPDTITFQPGLTGTILLEAMADELIITEDLTITGPGAATLAVKGGGLSRVFTIRNTARAITVGISGLTITGGTGDSNQFGVNFSFDGGGIYMADEIVTLDGVVLTGNLCPADFGGDGGGIATAPNGNLTIRNSTISGNSGNEGGGIYIGEGGSLIMENTTVSGNTAFPVAALGGGVFGGDGGGVFLYNRGSVEMENCTVSGNTALGENGGGGVYFYASAGDVSVTVRNSTIAGNTAQNGGGILLFALPGSNPVLLIQNSTITGNSAVTTSTTPGHGGGGIAAPANAAITQIISVVSSIVSGNTATAANGRDDIAMPNSTGVNVNFSAIGDADGFTQSGSSGNNLAFGTALGLNALANNGGPTQTVSFAANSPVRNAGSNPASLTTDQRGAGFVRVDGAAADIGAYEFQIAAPPQVASVTVNAGQADAVQRSRVTTLAVSFTAPVTFAGSVAAAFGLTRIGGGALGTFTATANAVGGVTVVTLTGFAGAETEFGSLADGRYTLTVFANQVSAGGVPLDGDGNGTAGDNYVEVGAPGSGHNLFRFFGDSNGDGTVNVTDFLAFRLAFLQQSASPIFDFNGNGQVDAADYLQFRLHFAQSV